MGPKEKDWLYHLQGKFGRIDLGLYSGLFKFDIYQIRHVKCDEAKPSCQKCTSTGRKCDGYSPTPGGNLSSIVCPRSLVVFPSPDSKEHRAFDYFMNCTALELTGYFSSDIWKQRVPRISLSESALFHIVIAMSSIHEGYASGNELSSRDNQLSLYSFALKHYAIAVRNLKEAIFSNPENLESVLLCCALFVCFDSLRGNYKAASTHLQSGLKILLCQKLTGSKISQDDGIVQAFTCLALQAGSFMDSHLPESTGLIWEQIHEINYEHEVSNFTTIDDARHNLNLLLSDFMLRHTQPRFHGTCPTSKETVISYDIKERLANWASTFDAMVRQKDPANLSSNALRAAILLKVHHASLTAMADTFQNTPCNAPYETIVTLARSLLSATASSAKTKACISSDLGLVGPLFVTISRCTVSQLRWEALALLKAVPRREGMWDAEVAARIAIGVLEIEERKCPGGLHTMQAMDSKIQEL